MGWLSFAWTMKREVFECVQKDSSKGQVEGQALGAQVFQWCPLGNSHLYHQAALLWTRTYLSQFPLSLSWDPETQNQPTALFQADGVGVLNCATSSSGPSFP